jgi:hypothetical protein
MYKRSPLSTRCVCFAPVTALLFAVLVASPAHAQAARDMIDLSQAGVYNSPTDVASWPITHAITGLHMRPTGAFNAGLSFDSSALDAWPDYVPPGFDGPLEYTVWAVININGTWYTSGIIQMWRGRVSTGAPLLTDFARNWVYDSRWGPMRGHQPVVGEQMGFFLTAGNARGVSTVTSVRERTNVVLVSVPAGDTGDFTFSSVSSTRVLLTGDFNNDGQVDIVSQAADGTVSLALNGGTSFNQVASPYNGVVSTWSIVGVADFNGDGRKDLLWQSPTGAVALWLNNGASAPTPLMIYSGVSDWRVKAVADLDHNGSPDLIWQSPSGQLVVWLMSGTTVASSQDLWRFSSDWRVVGAGDFNGDGDADILWQAPNGVLALWLMHGFTFSSGVTIYGAATPWVAISVGDVNGDSKPDIVWRGPTGQVVTWLMNGMTASQTKYLNELVAGWQLSSTP